MSKNPKHTVLKRIFSLQQRQKKKLSFTRAILCHDLSEKKKKKHLNSSMIEFTVFFVPMSEPKAKCSQLPSKKNMITAFRWNWCIFLEFCENGGRRAEWPAVCRGCHHPRGGTKRVHWCDTTDSLCIYVSAFFALLVWTPLLPLLLQP